MNEHLAVPKTTASHEHEQLVGMVQVIKAVADRCATLCDEHSWLCLNPTALRVGQSPDEGYAAKCPELLNHGLRLFQ